VAHVVEQQAENRLFRPRVRYEGPPYRPVPQPARR
jgi:citrate synthase